MELLQLKYFTDAAQLLSFSQVAKKYMVPPSSISHTIAKLENELGAQLFERSGNKLSLNDYGRAFYSNISTALEKIEAGRMLVNDMRDRTVSVTLRQCAYSIIPMLTAFKNEYPQLKLSFPFKNADKKGDFFLRISAKPFQNEDDFISLPLFTERILLAVPKCSPLAKKDRLCFEDIRDIPLVWYYEGTENEKISEYFAAHRAKPNILIYCAKDITVAEFVKNDFGIAFYPEYSSPIEKEDGICTVPLEGFDVKRTIYVSWPKEYLLTDAAKTFVDFGIDFFKNLYGE